MSEIVEQAKSALAAFDEYWGDGCPVEAAYGYPYEIIRGLLSEVRAGAAPEDLEWEYVPGWIADNGRARISQGVIAPGYVVEFIAEGGEVVRRRVSKFETVTADMAPVTQEGETE